MRKFIVALLALAFTSCSCDYFEPYDECAYSYTQQEYETMYGFVNDLYNSELFGLDRPNGNTYDELMTTAAGVIMTDIFGDTFGEGDCYEVYMLMLSYFRTVHPEAEITEYLDFIITNEMY